MSFWTRWPIQKFNPNHDEKGKFSSAEGIENHSLEAQAKAKGISVTNQQIGPIKLDTTLTGRAATVQKNSALKVALDPQKYFDAYKNLKDQKSGVNCTENGRLLNTDLARELFTPYLNDRTLSAAVHEPASYVIKQLYDQMIYTKASGDQTQTIFFTGGGTGAGKSTATHEVIPEVSQRAVATLDSNMGDYGKSVTRIDNALGAGNDVVIAYTDRNPIQALVAGALPRAMRQQERYGSGRTVPLREHLATHLNSYATAGKLIEHYKDDPRVQFKVIDNTDGKGGAFLSSYDKVQNPASIPAIMEKLKNALNQEYLGKRISKKIYNGFMHFS